MLSVLNQGVDASMEPPPVPPRSSRAPPSALTSVISDELVLGPFLSGSSVAELKTRGITHVVSVDEHYITKIDTVAPVHMTQIGIEDTVPPEDHVERKLEAVVKAIEDFLLQDGPKYVGNSLPNRATAQSVT